MAYDVKMYFNTGFDSVNIPDRPQLLESATTKTLPALQLVQDVFLSTVRVKATYQEVLGVDYVKIGDFFYSVEGYQMLNSNTCQLSLLLDAFTSGGGIGSMILESGWLKRAHEKKSSNLRENVIPEPFTPQEPLELVYLGHLGESPEGGTMTVVQSTINLASLGKDDALNALRFKAPDQVEDGDCFIPKLAKVLTDTTVKMPLLTTSDEQKLYTTTLPGATLYVVRKSGSDETLYDNIKEGLTNARSIGVESSITAQYNIPLQYIDNNNTTISEGFWQVSQIAANSQQFTLSGEGDYNFNSGAYSQKEFIGAYNKYIVVSTCSGSKVEANPEDVWEQGKTAPTLYLTSDLRSEGKPYMYFRAYQGYLNTTLQSVCEGLRWQNQPLIYSEKSGNALDTYNFQSSRYTSDFNRYSSVGGSILGTVGSVVSGAVSGFTGNPNFGEFASGRQSAFLNDSLAMSTATGAVGGISKLPGALYSTLTSGETYRNQRNKEILNFTASQAYVVPEVNFPRTEGLRDFLGNGFFVFRYRLSERDKQRQTMFFAMYGNAVSKPATISDFTNKINFNFVQSDDICVSFPGFSKVLNEQAQGQIRAGVRIWHTLPSPDKYLTNADSTT